MWAAGVSLRAFTLSASFFTSVFSQLSSASRSAAIYGAMAVSSEFELKLKQITRFTVDGLQQLLALVLPFELGDSDLLGDISQLAPGFIALRLEPAGVAITVA
jgi:hypothetical protein